MLKIFIAYLSFIAALQIECVSLRWDRDISNDWHGKWFPQELGIAEDLNPEVEYDPLNSSTERHDLHHIPMGIPNSMCDNAKENLTVDWDNSPVNFACFGVKRDYLPSPDVHPILHCDHIPYYYRAEHICMNASIEYDDPVPTFGPHRPLWAKYGEYLFLPKQRWIHNIEHGAVVMLYHPCANKNEVQHLRNLVQKCLYRHIITPYTLLSPDRPLVLVTWGCRFMMSKVDDVLVTEFIKRAALHGPEGVSKDGQYDFNLLKPAAVVSDVDDKLLCPNLV